MFYNYNKLLFFGVKRLFFNLICFNSVSRAIKHNFVWVSNWVHIFFVLISIMEWDNLQLRGLMCCV